MKTVDSMQHPSLEDLSDFLSDENHPLYHQTRWHVTQCPHCQQRSMQIEGIHRALRELPNQASNDSVLVAPPHLTEKEIDNYVSHTHETPQRQKWQQHLDQCEWCLERVLMTRANNIGETPAEKIVNNSVSFKEPKYWAIAATVLLAAIIIPLWQPSSPQWDIATYRDDPQLSISSKPSTGLGFFGEANVQKQPFGPVSVSFDGSDLRLSWPAVDNVSQYRLAVFQANSRTNRPLAQTTVDQPAAKFHVALKPNLRYTWVLSGEINGQPFSAKGGFVLK